MEKAKTTRLRALLYLIAFAAHVAFHLVIIAVLAWVLLRGPTGPYLPVILAIIVVPLVWSGWSFGCYLWQNGRPFLSRPEQ